MQGAGVARAVLQLAVQQQRLLELRGCGGQLALAHRDRAEAVPADRLAGPVALVLRQLQRQSEGLARAGHVAALPGVDRLLLQGVKWAGLSPRHRGLSQMS